MVPMLLNCKRKLPIGRKHKHKKRHEAQNALTPGGNCRERYKMKRRDMRPYSRSVHHTESILMRSPPNVKKICANGRKFL